MKNIEFWKEKYITLVGKFNNHYLSFLNHKHSFESFYSRKLKQRKGHALSSVSSFDGARKTWHRRAKWFRGRLYHLTRMGYYRREMKRLAETKLSFYSTQIIRLGGEDIWQDEWKPVIPLIDKPGFYNEFRPRKQAANYAVK